MTARLRERWNLYWFPGNLLLSASVARILLGITFLWCLVTIDHFDASILDNPIQERFYQPVSILQFYNGLPSSSFFAFIRIAAYVSTFFFLIGFLTRVMVWISFL